MGAQQLQFDFMGIYKKRYVAPDYIKFYTVYQYDRIKFKKLLRKEVAKLRPQSDEEFKEIQNRILIRCYIRDEFGKRKRDTDEKHIFRYKALDKILSEIYSRTRQVGNNSDLLFFDDEKQAELKNTWFLPVDERIKIHIGVLRQMERLLK